MCWQIDSVAGNGQASRTSEEQEALALLARNVKEARGRRGLTQEALGLEAGLDQTEVAHLEAERRNPGMLTLVRLARALEIPASDLLKGIE